MTRALHLQNFGTPSSLAPAVQVAPPDDQSGEQTLEAFERGYKSGWADCAAAENEEKRGIGAALAQAVSEARLTQDAARRDVLASLGPFFDEVVLTLLPKLAAEAIGPVVKAEMAELAEGNLEGPIEIHCAPSAFESIENLVETEGISGVSLKSEPTFGEGQVSLRIGPEQREIDMASAADRIAEAISGFRNESSNSSNPLSEGVA